MKQIEFLEEVETKFPVTEIKANGIQVWAMLRRYYFFAYNEKYLNSTISIKSNKSKIIITAINKIRHSFYGFANLFRSYEYLIFTNIAEIKNMGGHNINKIAHSLQEVLGLDKFLTIESSKGDNQFKIKRMKTNRTVSAALFHNLSRLQLFNKKIKTSGFDILDDINKKYGLNVNYYSIIKLFTKYLVLMKFLIKRKKPKIIFISKYYSVYNQAVIYSAGQLSVPVIEIQHGLINTSHPAYNVFTSLTNTLLPDYIFTFGENTQGVFKSINNHFIESNNVYPVGNMYLDYMNNEYIPNNRTVAQFNAFRKVYDTIVAVSSQLTIDEKLVNFINQAAIINHSILYIFIPRDLFMDYSKKIVNDNIKIINGLNVYEIIKESDFHSTVYSTCAIEAPAMGVQNVLINIKGLAVQNFGSVLIDKDITEYADTPKEFVNKILSMQKLEKMDIQNKHGRFYSTDHKQEIKKAIQDIISKLNY
jgi:hypothetical protein